MIQNRILYAFSSHEAARQWFMEKASSSGQDVDKNIARLEITLTNRVVLRAMVLDTPDKLSLLKGSHFDLVIESDNFRQPTGWQSFVNSVTA